MTVNHRKVWEMHARYKMTLTDIARNLGISIAEAREAMLYAWRTGKSCKWHYDREYEARHREK